MSQFFLEELAGSPQAGFDRIHRARQRIRQFPVAQSFDLSEREDETVLRRHMRGDSLHQFRIGDGLVEVLRIGQEAVKRLAVFLKKGFPRLGFFAAARSQEVATVVRGDPIEPRREGGLTPKSRKRLIGLQENLLSGVFGCGSIRQERGAQSQDSRLMRAHEIRVGVPPTGPNLFDEFTIFDRYLQRKTRS